MTAYIYIIKADMFVCLFRMAGQTAGPTRRNLTHALMSTQGVFLARSMSRSFTYACGSDRSTKHPQSDTWRTAHYGAHTTSGRRRRRHLAKDYETPSNYSSSNEARRRRRRAASAADGSRTPSGGRVLTASKDIYEVSIAAEMYDFE